MSPQVPGFVWTAERMSFASRIPCDERGCNNMAEHHDKEDRESPERHYCTEHAELYLWWYTEMPSTRPPWVRP